MSHHKSPSDLSSVYRPTAVLSITTNILYNYYSAGGGTGEHRSTTSSSSDSSGATVSCVACVCVRSKTSSSSEAGAGAGARARRGAGVATGGGGGRAASRSERFAARTTTVQSLSWSQVGHAPAGGTSAQAGAPRRRRACSARHVKCVGAPQRSHATNAPPVWKSKFYGNFTARSRRPPRHRRDSCSMAWRCRFLAARPSQRGHVVAEK